MRLSSPALRFAPHKWAAKSFINDAARQELSLPAAKIAKALAGMAILLAAMSVVGQTIRLTTGHEYMFGFVPQFNLDGENNIPSYFSSMLLLAAAILLFVTGSLSKGQRYARHWSGLGAIFLLMSLDEITSMHEMLIVPLRGAFKASGVFHYAWVIAAIPFVIVLGVSYLGFLRNLSPSFRRLFFASAALYVGGALGMELVGGLYAERYGVNTMGYVGLTTIEESLEMGGAILFVYSLLRYLGSLVPSLSLRFGDAVVNQPACPPVELS